MRDENGYGKPPKKNQFQKGQSGNPKGRPRASARGGDKPVALLDMVSKVSNRKVDATERGKKISIPSVEFLINKTFHDALHGDAKAREQIFRLIEKADLAALEGRTSEPLHIIITGGLPDD